MRNFILFVIAVSFQGLNAQGLTLRLGGNTYYPIGNPEKGQYPILWYSGADDRGILLGGFGGTVALERPLRGDNAIQYRLNVQSSRYYDVPTIFTDENGSLFGAAIGINTHLSIAAACMPELRLGKRNNLGLATGLGLRSVVWSRTDYGEAVLYGETRSLKLRDHSLSPLVLVLPLELSYRLGKRIVFSTRAEFSLTSVVRLDVQKSERNLLWISEVGYRFGKGQD